MLRIARLLDGVARSIAIVEWTDALDGGDAADFMASGATEATAMALPIVSADLFLEEAAESNVTLQTRSAGGSTHRVAEVNLPFQTAREFAASSPAEVSWVAKPYVAAGAITGVDGKIKAAGKTTLVTHLCRAVLDGLPFLGASTHRTGIVYLTEQPPSSFREALRRADLLDRDDFVFLTWRDASGTAWANVVAAAVVEAADRGAGLLVVDTLSRFAGIHGDGENNAGEAEAAMAPLQLAAADGLAVVVVRHERKAGGEVGDSGRGSTAFGGAADIVMAVRRTSGDRTNARNTREIHALSRFDETPDLLIVELTESGYRAIGDRAVAVHEDAKATILGIVSSSSGLGLTIDQVVEQSKHGRTTTQDVLEELAAEGIVTKDGRGVRGDPYRYRATSADVVETDPGAVRPRDALQLADLLRHVGGDMESIGDFHN
jgi:hypothetical protein